MNTEQTAAVVRRRLEVIRTGDVDAIMQDYTEESTIYTPDCPVKGLEAIRALFDAFFAGPFAEVQSLEVLRQDCDGEFAYLFWKAETAAVKIPVATDTFIIRDGKIVDQSVAAHIIPEGQERAFFSGAKSKMSQRLDLRNFCSWAMQAP